MMRLDKILNEQQTNNNTNTTTRVNVLHKNYRSNLRN